MSVKVVKDLLDRHCDLKCNGRRYIYRFLKPFPPYHECNKVSSGRIYTPLITGCRAIGNKKLVLRVMKED